MNAGSHETRQKLILPLFLLPPIPSLTPDRMDATSEAKHLYSPQGTDAPNLYPLDKVLLTTKVDNTVASVLTEMDGLQARAVWYIDDTNEPPTPFFIAKDVESAVQWAKNTLPAEDWERILAGGSITQESERKQRGNNSTERDYVSEIADADLQDALDEVENGNVTITITPTDEEALVRTVTNNNRRKIRKRAEHLAAEEAIVHHARTPKRRRRQVTRTITTSTVPESSNDDDDDNNKSDAAEPVPRRLTDEPSTPVQPVPSSEGFPRPETPSEESILPTIPESDKPPLLVALRATVKPFKACVQSGRINFEFAMDMLAKARAIAGPDVIEEWRHIAMAWNADGRASITPLPSSQVSLGRLATLLLDEDGDGERDQSVVTSSVEGKVACFRDALNVVKASEGRNRLHLFLHRRMLADFYKKYRSAEAAMLPACRTSVGVTKAAIIKIRLFRETHPEFAEIARP